MADFTERTDHRLSLADLRRSYTVGGLTEADCDSNPIVQFLRWFSDSQVLDSIERNAMTLATATADGKPSARVVLLKEVSDVGFVFYTNYTSRKADELAANPHAALTFYWGPLERQVRVEGRVEKVNRQTSELYFKTRPKGSRLGAWVSEQSKPVNGRGSLEERLQELETEYEETNDVPTPEFWGGYRVIPEVMEFWQGRPNRLHDRIVYTRDGDSWSMGRLWP